MAEQDFPTELAKVLNQYRRGFVILDEAVAKVIEISANFFHPKPPTQTSTKKPNGVEVLAANAEATTGFEEEEIKSLLGGLLLEPPMVSALAAYVREAKVQAFMDGQEAGQHAGGWEIDTPADPDHNQRWQVVINLGSMDGLFTMMPYNNEDPTFDTKESAQNVANAVQRWLGRSCVVEVRPA